MRSTETGVRPTVGARLAPSDGRAERLGAAPVGLTLGALRFTEAVPVGRFATASATLALGATAAGRR
ncbi:MAG: hypothetical protein O2958_07295 [Gemmatimonadetes bacterium]|nr:hypothetical protein [Gemmatimonadota bacterium]